ncbi:MAG: type VI secretion system contractile sheath domain-containing protein [Planctomycetota bacterium]|jgi:type VI secretion system protein ImpC
MAMQFSSGKMDFELTTSFKTAPNQTSEQRPFCIAIMADFSGRSNRGLCESDFPLAAGRRIPVDVDNFEKLPAKLGTEIHIPVGNSDGIHLPVRFGELEDFHPDKIFDRLEVFQKLKLIRKNLQDPTTFAQAAAQVRSWTTGESPGEDNKTVQTGESAAESQESDVDMVERLLGQRPSREQPSASQFVDVDKLIREMVKPYVVPAPDPQQADIIAQVDEVISGQMRAIMHNQDFQSLESAWRTLHLLVSRIETDETLKLYLVDISKDELAADLVSANQLQSTGTYRLFAEQDVSVQSSEQWTLLVGGYIFDQTEKDIALLQKLAQVAQAASAPFLAAACPHFAGCQSFAATPEPDDWQWKPDATVARQWQQFRSSPEAAFVGLVLPRFLLRLPYGKETEPIDRFDFEEITSAVNHEEYLWGNPAAVCACLLAEAYRELGWSFTRGLGCELGQLPMHIYKSGGEKHITPCAEAFLTERAMQVLIDKGLMPLISIKGRDAVLLARFQSIAEPLAPLSGSWR